MVSDDSHPPSVSSSNRLQSSGPSNSRKISNKRSHIQSAVATLNTQEETLADIVRSSTSVKLAQIESKRQRKTLEFERDEKRLAAEERAMKLRVESHERVVKMRIDMEREIALTRLKVGQPSGTANAHRVGFMGEDHLAGAFPSNFSDPFANPTSSTALASLPSLPPLPSDSWETPGASGL